MGKRRREKKTVRDKARDKTIYRERHGDGRERDMEMRERETRRWERETEMGERVMEMREKHGDGRERDMEMGERDMDMGERDTHRKISKKHHNSRVRDEICMASLLCGSAVQ